METPVNETISQEAGPTLQLKKSLLPINEYAAREGVSRSIVEECGKLGIVQIRRYKGKTFVVDVPLSPYPYTSETTKESTQPIDKSTQARKISELVQKVILDVPEISEGAAKSGDEPTKAGTISELVKRMFAKAHQVTGKPVEIIGDGTGRAENIFEPAQIIYPPTSKSADQSGPLINDSSICKNASESIQTKETGAAEVVNTPTTAADEITLTEKLSEPIPTPELEAIEITDESPEAVGEAVKTGGTPESASTLQNDGSRFDISTTQAGSKHSWQVATVFLLAFLFAAIFANLWFYVDRKVQLGRLDQAYTTIQKLYNDLTEAGGNLETIKEHSSRAVKQLNKQIRNPAARLAEPIENP